VTGVKPGTHVEVRNSFDQGWSRGFEIAEIVEESDKLRIRRRSDGAVLPVTFEVDDVREERRRKMWWV
jgi:hypothetical protein